jgi:hypothetical protein
MIEIPGFDSAWEMISDCELYPAERVSVAMMIFYMEWVERFGESTQVKDSINTLLIEWSDDDRGGSAYAVDGRRITNASFVGLTTSPGFIWVKVSYPPERICETSLVHELTHASIWAIKGTDGDPDHLGDVYFGWSTKHSLMIQEVNELLCRLGI